MSALLEETTVRGVRFANERDRRPEPWEGPVLHLMGQKHVIRMAKKGTPAFSAAVYREGAARGKEGVVEATALVLDFDHLSEADEGAVFRTVEGRGWAFAAYTSFSHQATGEDDRCFRLVLLVSRPVLPAEYEAVWRATDRALGGKADKNARDISRIWYVAACPPERAERAWIRHEDGRPIDVDAAILAGRKRREARKDDGEVSGLPRDVGGDFWEGLRVPPSGVLAQRRVRVGRTLAVLGGSV